MTNNITGGKIISLDTRSKGNKNENKARKILEAAGYLVEKKRRSRYSGGDFFKLWDLIALNLQGWRLIQVKTNKWDSTPMEKEQMNMFAVPPHTSKEVWVFYDRVKEPKIIVL